MSMHLANIRPSTLNIRSSWEYLSSFEKKNNKATTRRTTKIFLMGHGLNFFGSAFTEIANGATIPDTYQMHQHLSNATIPKPIGELHHVHSPPTQHPLVAAGVVEI